MRIITQNAKRFEGTHKGAWIGIDREPDGLYYIMVRAKSGGILYDGWAPDTVMTIAQAKKQAVAGACLDRPKSWWANLDTIQALEDFRRTSFRYDPSAPRSR